MLIRHRRTPILLVAALALAAPVSVFSGGAGEDVFEPVDALVEQGSFDEAILELTAIIQSNPELFDVAEARLREIRRRRDTYNDSLDELVTVLNPAPGEELNVDRALELIAELQIIEPDPNARVERQVQEARYTLALQSDREARQRILDQAAAQIAARQYPEAIETYLGGFDLQRVELEQPDEFTRTVRVTFPSDFVAEVAQAREDLRTGAESWISAQPQVASLGVQLTDSVDTVGSTAQSERSSVQELLDQLEAEVVRLEELRAGMQEASTTLLELRNRVFAEFPQAQGDDDEHIQYLLEFSAGIAQPELDVGILAATREGRFQDLASASDRWFAALVEMRTRLTGAPATGDFTGVPDLLDVARWTGEQIIRIASLQEGIVLQPGSPSAGWTGGAERNAPILRSASLQRDLAALLLPVVGPIERADQLNPEPLEQPEDPEGEVAALNQLRAEQQSVRAELDSFLESFLGLAQSLPQDPSDADQALLGAWRTTLQESIQRTRENEVLTVLRLADLGATPLEDQLNAAIAERERSRSTWFQQETLLSETGDPLLDPDTGEAETVTRAYPDRVLSGGPDAPVSGPAGASGALVSLEGVIRSASELLEVLDTEGGFVAQDERFNRIRGDIAALLEQAQTELQATRSLVSEAETALAEAARLRQRYDNGEQAADAAIATLETQVQRRSLSAAAARSRIQTLREDVAQTQRIAGESLDLRWVPAFNGEASAEIADLGNRLGALDQQIGLLEINDLYLEALALYEQGQDEGNLSFLERALATIEEAIRLRDNLFPGEPDRSLLTLEGRVAVAIEFLDDTDVRPGDSLYPIVNARLSQGNTLLARTRETPVAERAPILTAAQERFEEVRDIQSRNRDARFGLLQVELLSDPQAFPQTFQSLVGEAVGDADDALAGRAGASLVQAYDVVLDLIDIGEEYLRSIGGNSSVSAGLRLLTPRENELAIALGLIPPPLSAAQIRARDLVAQAQRLWNPLRAEFTGPPALDFLEQAINLDPDVAGAQFLIDTIRRSLNQGTVRVLTLQPPDQAPQWLANAQRLIANGTQAFGDLRRLWNYSANRNNPDVRTLVNQFIQANPGFRDQFPGL